MWSSELPGDPVGLIAEGREKLAAEDRGGWSNSAMSDRMISVGTEWERLGAEYLRITSEWDARGAWGEDGFVSARSWLTAHGGMTRAAAGRFLRSARHCARFSRTATALADGAVTIEKLDLLSESARHREELYARDEEMLLDIAARLDARDLAVALRTWRLLADDELADGDAKNAFDRVHFDIANGLLGADLAGFLDPEGAATLAKALDLIEPPDPVAAYQEDGDAPRTLSQRRGEGLVKLAQFFLGRRASNGSGHSTPNVEAVFTLHHEHQPVEQWRSELLRFGPVAPSTIERLLCDCNLGGVRLDERGEVLDLGRRSRTPSTAQRRAVLVRDQHCQHPGCRAPAQWCDVHHLVEWEHGGTTDLANLVLLCRRHHVGVHEGRHRLVRDADGTVRVERGITGRRRRSRRRARGAPTGESRD